MRFMHEHGLYNTANDQAEDTGSDRQEIFHEMEKRYDSAFVQSIRDHIHAADIRDVQYMEMKQMQEILCRYRGRVRHMIKLYRQWKKGYEFEKDELEKVYLAYEGIFLRQQLHDSWQLYVTVNRDYHEMRNTYLAQLSRNPHWYSRA